MCLVGHWSVKHDKSAGLDAVVHRLCELWKLHAPPLLMGMISHATPAEYRNAELRLFSVFSGLGLAPDTSQVHK